MFVLSLRVLVVCLENYGFFFPAEWHNSNLTENPAQILFRFH
jgi:hypothetical protein